jgi:hypothetical protein
METKENMNNKPISESLDADDPQVDNDDEQS